MKINMFVENYCILAYNFNMTVTRNDTATQKTLFWIPSHAVFFCFVSFELTKVTLVGKILRYSFGIVLHI